MDNRLFSDENMELWVSMFGRDVAIKAKSGNVEIVESILDKLDDLEEKTEGHEQFLDIRRKMVLWGDYAAELGISYGKMLCIHGYKAWGDSYFINDEYELAYDEYSDMLKWPGDLEKDMAVDEQWRIFAKKMKIYAWYRCALCRYWQDETDVALMMLGDNKFDGADSILDLLKAQCLFEKIDNFTFDNVKMCIELISDRLDKIDQEYLNDRGYILKGDMNLVLNAYMTLALLKRTLNDIKGAYYVIKEGSVKYDRLAPFLGNELSKYFIDGCGNYTYNE